MHNEVTGEVTGASSAVDVATSQTADKAADAAGQGETLLTQNVSADKPADKAADKPTDNLGKPETSEKPAEPQDPLALVPEKPDGYQLAFDNNMQVDQALQTQFCNTAHELGLNQGQAQKLAALYAGHVANAQSESQKHFTAAVTGWEQEIKGSPDFNNNLGHAQKALAQYGSNELFAVLDQTALGSHPAMFSFIAKIGKELAEPNFQRGEAAGQAKSIEQILYPNS